MKFLKLIAKAFLLVLIVMIVACGFAIAVSLFLDFLAETIGHKETVIVVGVGVLVVATSLTVAVVWRGK